MSVSMARRALALTVLISVAGCTNRTPPRIVLPDSSAIALSDLVSRYPLAAGQSVRAERLGATALVSYHFVQLAPGAGERLHLHAQHDLVATVLRGTGTQWVGDRQMHMQAGDTVIVPAGTPHRFVNTGDGPAATLVVFSPPYDGTDQVFLVQR